MQATDVRVQQAVAATSAGPNPIIPGPTLSTPGADWLDKMREMDAALCNAVQKTDQAPHRPIP